MHDVTIGREHIDELSQTLRGIPPRLLSQEQRTRLQGVLAITGSILESANGTSPARHELDVDAERSTVIRVAIEPEPLDPAFTSAEPAGLSAGPPTLMRKIGDPEILPTVPVDRPAEDSHPSGHRQTVPEDDEAR